MHPTESWRGRTSLRRGNSLCRLSSMFIQDSRIPRSISIENSSGPETNYVFRDSSPPTCRSCDRSGCLSKKNMPRSDSAYSTSSTVPIIAMCRTILTVRVLANSSTAQAAHFTANSYWSFDYEADNQEGLSQSDVSFVGASRVGPIERSTAFGRGPCRKDDAV